MVKQSNYTGGLATIAVIEARLKNQPKYYGRVHCSDANPMVELKEVELILANLESNMLDEKV